MAPELEKLQKFNFNLDELLKVNNYLRSDDKNIQKLFIYDKAGKEPFKIIKWLVRKQQIQEGSMIELKIITKKNKSLAFRYYECKIKVMKG